MLAKHEVWKYSGNERVWVGKYRNSHNLPHWHYDCELLFVESGSIDVFCEKQRHTLTAGQALFVDSGQVHYMRAQTPDTVLAVTIFDYNIIKPFAAKFCLASPRLEGDYNLPAVYARVKRELEGGKFLGDIAASLEIARLMIEIMRGEDLIPRPEIGTTVQSLKNLLGEINEKFEFYTFDEAASYMGMSPAYFSRFFHNLVGMTFSQYLNYVRIENAVKLIHSSERLQITEVAIRCGFSTIRNFNRTFKELTGYQPKRLPADFTLDEKFSAVGSESFDPTQPGCELIESS